MKVGDHNLTLITFGSPSIKKGTTNHKIKTHINYTINPQKIIILEYVHF